MAWRYQVRVKNAAGALVAVIEDASFTIVRKVNDIGSHRLDISGISPNALVFVLDGQVEVWRRDIVEDIDWYLEYEGFHRTPIWFTTQEGDDRFISLGVTYEDLLKRRIILYAKDSAGAAKSGSGESVIKDYVDENAGPGATSPPRELSSGVTAGLIIEADNAAGGSWAGDRAYENLLDVVKEIAQATGVDFRTIGTGPATFEFQAGDLATDRTTDGLNPITGLNGVGNAPVIFALGFGNMISPSYSVEHREEGNAVAVLGQGIEDDRVLIERSDAAAIAASTWNRSEASKNANQEDTVQGLNSAGDALLDQLQAKETLDFEVVQTPASLYGRDYFLGDLVTARYKDFEVNRQIQEVEIEIADGHETIRILMGEPA